MFRKSFILFVIYSLNFTALAKASEPKYVEHPYPFIRFTRQRPIFEHRKHRLPEGFGDHSYALAFVNYYNSLVFSGRKTPKGRYYSECEYELTLDVQIQRTPTNIYSSSRSHHDYNNTLDYFYLHQFPPSVRFRSFRPKQSGFLSSLNVSNIFSSEMTKAQIKSDQNNDSPNKFRWYTSGITFKSDLPIHIYRNYGCDLVIEEEEEEKKDPSCPNLFIRGLPFIRNTVTCILKNR